MIFLPPSIEPIHRQIVSPNPSRLTVFVLLYNEVLSKAPSISGKAPSVMSLFSNVFQ